MGIRQIRSASVVVVVLLLLSSVEARVTDVIVALDPLLQRITNFLDSKGIDIRNGDATAFVGEHGRPQFTRLRNFVASDALAGEDNVFSYHFDSGTISDRAYLVAVNFEGTEQTMSQNKFKEIWDRALPSDRILVSFSGKDLNYALTVADALRVQGYTFSYIKTVRRDCLA